MALSQAAAQQRSAGPVAASGRRARRCTCVAAASASTNGSAPDAVAVLRAAAEHKSASPSQVCAAMVAVEESRALPLDQLASLLGGEGAAAGRPTQWRLVFTSSSKDLTAQRKTGRGDGKYFPISAVQSWSPPAGEVTGAIRNGVYLGHWAALQFDGPFLLAGKKLAFDFDKLSLKLFGLKGSFRLKPAGYSLPMGSDAVRKLPFFLFAHADGELVVARGRSGGLALWAKAKPTWLLESGAANTL